MLLFTQLFYIKLVAKLKNQSGNNLLLLLGILWTEKRISKIKETSIFFVVKGALRLILSLVSSWTLCHLLLFLISQRSPGALLFPPQPASPRGRGGVKVQWTHASGSAVTSATREAKLVHVFGSNFISFCSLLEADFCLFNVWHEMRNV